MNNRVAFLTMDDLSGFVTDDELLIEPLHLIGIDVELVSWRADENWQRFDAVVIRSTWDYQGDAENFLEVLQEIDLSGTKLLNSLAIVRNNIDKSYLRDLENNGIDIAPTIWLDQFGQDAIKHAENQFETNQLILKPTVSANADNTFRIDTSSPDTASDPVALAQQLAGKKLMLQPFLESVTRDGEYSAFLIGGELTHAILKTPKVGDFRVQEEHGGKIVSIDPDQQLLEFCEKVKTALPADLLYARIDCVRFEEKLVVMEVELIEPSLYFRFSETAIKRFSHALAQRIGQI